MDAAAEHDWVKEATLIEALRDWIQLGEVHRLFATSSPPRPTHEVQRLTLAMIRELVCEGLCVLGVPAGPWRKPHFEAWDLPLDAAMAKIEEAYVTHFDDRWNWVTMCWLDLTEKGKKLALELYHADEPESSQKVEESP